jgi:hypothetical protein
MATAKPDKVPREPIRCVDSRISLEEEARGITPTAEHDTDAGVIKANHQPRGTRRSFWRSYQKTENVKIG